MRRADRLFQIVQHLRGGRLVTAQGLADRLEVTKRTIYRDIVDLQASGVPIEGEAGVGYIMREGFDLPPLMFTTAEVAALVAGARLVRAWGGTRMAEAAEEALVKIEAVLPAEARARAAEVPVHALAFALPDAVRGRLDRIGAAIEARLRLRLDYRDGLGAASLRSVRPLGLFFWGRTWTLVAWCELRDDFRAFRVDRIAEVHEADRFRPERGQTLRDYYRQERECADRARIAEAGQGR